MGADVLYKLYPYLWHRAGACGLLMGGPACTCGLEAARRAVEAALAGKGAP